MRTPLLRAHNGGIGRTVKRERLIEMRSALRDVSRERQGSAHEAMPNHELDYRLLLLGECRNCAANSRATSPWNATVFATQKP